MAKTTQVLKLNDHGERFTVVKRNDIRNNPYRVYKHFWDGGKPHKIMVAKYQTMESVLFYLSADSAFRQDD